jgi:hypothetical protein
MSHFDTETTLLHVKHFVDTYNPDVTDMADIGGAGYEDYLSHIGLSPKVYDPLYDSAYDACRNKLPKQYKTIITCNTLEHVYDPIRFAENVIASLLPGGLLFATTVFMYHQHSKEGYSDYFRFTDEAMRHLFGKLECLECFYDKDSTSSNDNSRVTFIGRKNAN